MTPEQLAKCIKPLVWDVEDDGTFTCGEYTIIHDDGMPPDRRFRALICGAWVPHATLDSAMSSLQTYHAARIAPLIDWDAVAVIKREDA